MRLSNLPNFKSVIKHMSEFSLLIDFQKLILCCSVIFGLILQDLLHLDSTVTGITTGPTVSVDKLCYSLLLLRDLYNIRSTFNLGIGTKKGEINSLTYFPG